MIEREWELLSAASVASNLSLIDLNVHCPNIPPCLSGFFIVIYPVLTNEKVSTQASGATDDHGRVFPGDLN